MQFLKDMEDKVRELLPPDCDVTSLDVEGPEIILYTKNIDKFLNDESLIKRLAGTLKKRFVVRSDPAMLMDPEEAKKKIEEIVPPEAEIKSIRFDPEFNEVNIEAKKLGLVIGAHGSTLKRITSETKWTPKPLRMPTSESKMMKGIRETLIRESEVHKKVLKKVGKRIYREQSKPTDWIRITGLGGWREVGRSCMLIETPESKVMLDCGVNVASNESPFPYLSSVDFSLEELDAVILSHAHLDHCGFLPYLFQYGYEGPVYCTTATRDLMVLLQEDYISVLGKSAKTPPYSQKDIKKELLHCIPKGYGEVTDITPDMRLTLHNAGHILGSSLVHLHIGEGAHNLLYTGDLKFGYTELFDPAETRFPRLETMIIESTYGGQRDIQKPRYMSEKYLIDLIKKVTSQNGLVLIPTFAVGRAQEVMMIIEAYARKHGDWDIPVYLDGMTREASAIHSAYSEYLKRSLERRILHNDSPFDSNIFQIVEPNQREQIAEDGRCVVLAPAGMMNGGPVVEYFKRCCDNPKNAIIFVGYQAEGSLGRKIQQGAKEVVLENNSPEGQGKSQAYKINALVETVESFSGHADLNQLLGYFKKVTPRPERVLVVHGEEKSAMNFARSLNYKFHVEASAPRNLDSIRLK
ncbi:MAG: beta-CASP ribonuclease aCPSF1 [Candidatus Micrarchaeota archaeon]